MPRSHSLPELLNLTLIAAGFSAAILLYSALFPVNFDFLTTDEVILGFAVGVCTFWIAVQVAETSQSSSALVRFIDEVRVGTGANLIVQALLNYLNALTRSLFLIVVGGVFAALLLALARLLFRSRVSARAGSFIVGFEPAVAELAPLLPTPILGIVAPTPALPGVPVSAYDEFETAIAGKQPRLVVVTDRGASHVPPSILLSQNREGTSVTPLSDVYESLLQRVYCRGRNPMNLALARALSGNPQAMAFQAIYTNLTGLVLLTLSLPAMLLIALALALFSRPGPIFESAECVGFHKIPFRRLSFRTRKSDGSGGATRLGVFLLRSRLANLPLLFNIVRGEMALFGPRPIRYEFAARLTEMMPFFSVRFAVKPGLIGWGSRRRPGYMPASELEQIEYDLYYVKHGSLLLDSDILMRRLFGGGNAPESRAEMAAAR